MQHIITIRQQLHKLLHLLHNRFPPLHISLEKVFIYHPKLVNIIKINHYLIFSYFYHTVFFFETENIYRKK